MLSGSRRPCDIHSLTSGPIHIGRTTMQAKRPSVARSAALVSLFTLAPFASAQSISAGADVHNQSVAQAAWESRVEQTWPGNSLGKATQRQCEQWLATHGQRDSQLDLALGKRVLP